MWYNESTIYQIYPIGFCGAPRQNDGQVVSRILDVLEWTEHLTTLGVDAVLFNPVFDSDNHGYDTRDLRKIDGRLGTNEDFKKVCDHLKDNGIRIILDGVFNHVGRGFWAFRDVMEKKGSSAYRNWFQIDFGREDGYGDGFYYEGWEGHYELVKLNLKNPEVVDHILACVKGWVEEFGIDGLRLDVAYSLDREFLRSLRRFCDGLKPDFVLIGEMIHGDYHQIVGSETLHSCTNYECYKGIYSSINEANMFEISYSLNRQFGSENWTLYKGMHLLNFVDNHDVSRIASALKERVQLPLAYGLMFAMPGVPCLYYGSEWGALGEKKDGDDALRPQFDAPIRNETTKHIEKLIRIRRGSKALCYGTYCNHTVTNRQLVIERQYEGETALACFNLDSAPYEVQLQQNATVEEELTGRATDLSRAVTIPPNGMLMFLVR